MKTYKSDNKTKSKKLGKQRFFMYGLFALVLITAVAAAVQIIPADNSNSAATGDIWAGFGTVNDPYQIGSVEDLAKLADDVNTNGNIHEGDWFILTKDLDLNAMPWTPIGNNTTNFSGNFNGNGHSISNLFINSGNYIGLFGVVTNGIIENLGIVNANVMGVSSVGGLIGNTSNSMIENCYVMGKVTGYSGVGGVVGANGSVNNNTGSTVVNCYNTGDIILTSGGNSVGGVVGFNNGTVENCFNTGAVGGPDRVGGVVGQNYFDGTVENCYNTGAVTGAVTVSGGSWVGGLSGMNYGTVENCYNTGAVTGNGGEVGGEVGYNGGTVENCYNAYMVTGNGGVVGGVVGGNVGGTVENCYNSGVVTSNGAVAGGVVGAGGIVENCFFLKLTGAINSDLNGIGSPGSDDNAAAIGDAEMRTQSTFPAYNLLTEKGWDFDGIGGASPIWFILEGKTYPMLFWQIADSGNGADAGHSYIITTIQQLESIENIFVLHNASGGVYWKLGSDIDVAGYFAEGSPGYNGGSGWVPIGDSTYSFEGSFDGNSHTVSNLFINDSSDDNIGLFGVVTNGTIENLGLVNAIVSGNNKVGGLIGSATDCMIENCYNTGTVNGNIQVGGVVGGNGGTIDNCYNTGTVSGGGWVGGLSGMNYGTVENCYNTGAVTLIEISYNIGGVVGFNGGGTVENCYNTGAVSGIGYNIGGVVGVNGDAFLAFGGTVENCYNTGAVSGSGDYIGGVVGGNNDTVENCYNTGVFTLNGTSGYCMGGVVGYNTGTVENCYNTGDVYGSYGYYVGGVVGENGDAVLAFGGTVENCYNTGAVYGYGYYVGGVVGGNDDTVENCFFLQGGSINEVLSGYFDNDQNKYLNDGAQPVGDAEMRTQNTFPTFDSNTEEGWDFSSTGPWGIYLINNDQGSPGYGCPYIKTIENYILITPDGGSKVFDGNPAPVPTWAPDNPTDKSLFTGSLSYDPTPAVDVNTYKITMGTLDSPYYQIRFKDDVQYEITSLPTSLILIHTPQELALIGNDPNYPLDGNYQLANDIVFNSADDTNGGIDIGISAVVSGSDLTVTLTPLSGSVTSLNAWMGTSSANSSDNTVMLSDIQSGVYTLTVGGTAGDYPFAYSVKIDTSTSGIEATFNSNGNLDPIGNPSTPFTGIFDGNGFEISGMNVNILSSSSDVYAGLFGFVSGAQINNLGVIDSTITATSSNYAYVGGIVGYSNSAITILNCYNTGNVFVSNTSSYEESFAGGIVGFADLAITISNCYNIGNVSALAISLSLCASAGGIVGYANSAIMWNCYNTGNVSAYATPSGAASAGGIAGDLGSVTMSDCYNTGDVSASATSSYYAYAGGIAGDAGYLGSAIISNCYNAGDVSASASPSSVASAGGIAGDAGYAGPAIVSNCYFLTGTVSCNSVFEDRICGSLANPESILNDGGTGDQASGAKTMVQMMPFIQDARYGSSIYYSDYTGSGGWDFYNIWGISPEINNGYPYLRSLEGYSVSINTDSPGSKAGLVRYSTDDGMTWSDWDTHFDLTDVAINTSITVEMQIEEPCLFSYWTSTTFDSDYSSSTSYSFEPSLNESVTGNTEITVHFTNDTPKKLTFNENNPDYGFAWLRILGGDFYGVSSGQVVTLSSGTDVTIEAISWYEYRFDHWEADYYEGTNPVSNPLNSTLSFSMDGDKEITAYFEVAPVLPNGISTADELYLFAEYVNDGKISDGDYYLLNDIDLNDLSAENKMRIDWDEKGWLPIAYSNYFSGTFDGRGHKIIGLWMDRDGDVGLFGFISGGTIENLNVETDPLKGVNGQGSIGILAGELFDSTVENCYTQGTIKISVPDSNGNLLAVGGLAGIVEGGEVGGNIADCHSSVNICADLSGTPYYNIGGFAGAAWGHLEVSNCYAQGIISVTVGGLQNDWIGVGGFAGELSGASVRDCYTLCEIAFDAKDVSVDDSYNALLEYYYGIPVASGTVGGFAGGIGDSISTYADGTEITYTGTVENSYSAGKITTEGNIWEGGFAGLINFDTILSNNYFIQSGNKGVGLLPIQDLNHNGINDATEDWYDEYMHGLGPNAVDSDGDGFSDMMENAFGSDPNDPLSTPQDINGNGIPDWLDDTFVIPPHEVLSKVGADVEGVDSVTENEMTQSSTFSGWDFSDVWGIYEGSGFPYLKTFGNNLLVSPLDGSVNKDYQIISGNENYDTKHPLQFILTTENGKPILDRSAENVGYYQISVAGTAIDSVSLDKSVMNIVVGDTQQLTATVLPSDADQNVTWSSSDVTVATVDQNGKVTGISAGIAVITAITIDGQTAKCFVAVNDTLRQFDYLNAYYDGTNVNVSGGIQSSGGVQLDVYDPNGVLRASAYVWPDTDHSFAASIAVVLEIGTGYYVEASAYQPDGFTIYAVAPFDVKPVQVTGVTVTPATLNLTVGNSQQLAADVLPSNAADKSVTWSSSNDAVTTVDQNGVVKGIAAGTAVITVTTKNNSFTASCTVSVNNVKHFDSLSAYYDGTNVIVQGSIQDTDSITFVVYDPNGNPKATVSDTPGAGGSFSVSILVYLVAGKGYYVVASAYKTGEDTAYGTAPFDVTVPVTGVTLDLDSVGINVGDTVLLHATLTPVDATNQSIKWSSSDNSVVTVDQNGKIIGKSAGTATITVTTDDGPFTAKCEVTVSAPVTDITRVPLIATAGVPLALNGTVSPSYAEFKDIVWTIKDAGDTGAEINGNVFLAPDMGRAVITATILNGIAPGVDFVKDFTVIVTLDGRIPISTPQELAMIGNEYPINGNYYLTNDIVFGSIDTNGSAPGNFTPIGSFSSPFTGTFDGSGYVISGMIVSVAPSGDAYAGLFACVMDSKIFDLGMVSGSVTVTLPGGYVYAGGIVGAVLDDGSPSILKTTITNCYNTCPVTASSIKGAVFAGGILGGIYNQNNKSTVLTIADCYNTGTITASTPAGSNGWIYSTFAGGIAGSIMVYGSDSGSSTTITMERCFNDGSVVVTSAVYNGAAGGIAGVLNGRYPSQNSSTLITVSDCYNMGLISLSNIGNQGWLSGIAGWLGTDLASSSSISLSVNDCYSAGSLSASNAGAYAVGGIVGYADRYNGYGEPTINVSVTNCYFLEKKMTVKGSTSADNISGSVSSIVTYLVDGNIGNAPRAGVQGSGAKTAVQMTPTIENAQNGDSPYYTGLTRVNSLYVGGWDFFSVWTIVPGVNNGYPILLSAGNTIPVTGVTVDQTEISINTNEMQQLFATVLPSDATNKGVTWFTSDPAIASVDQNGIVTGKSAGTAVITVMTNDSGYEASCKVTVAAIPITIVHVDGVALNLNSSELMTDETLRLIATVSPSNASDKSVHWSSDNSSVAFVDQNGLVTGKSEGTAIITVTTNDGGYEDTCKVTVTAPPVVHVDGVTLDTTSMELAINETQRLIATVSPSNATDKSVYWSSDNASVASVDKNGNVTGKSAGTAYITVTTNDSGYTATCKVTVEATVAVSTVTFTAEIAEGYPGETIPITFSVTGNTGFVLGGLGVDFGSNLSYVSVDELGFFATQGSSSCIFSPTTQRLTAELGTDDFTNTTYTGDAFVIWATITDSGSVMITVYNQSGFYDQTVTSLQNVIVNGYTLNDTVADEKSSGVPSSKAFVYQGVYDVPSAVAGHLLSSVSLEPGYQWVSPDSKFVLGTNDYAVLNTETGKTFMLSVTAEQPVMYTVTFDSDGGTSVPPQTVEQGFTAAEPTEPIKQYYRLVEWQYNGVVYDFSTPVTGNITLVAYWELAYNLTISPAANISGYQYSFNGTDWSDYTSQVSINGDEVWIKAIVNDGCYFVNWQSGVTDNPAHITGITSNLSYTPTAVQVITYSYNTSNHTATVTSIYAGYSGQLSIPETTVYASESYSVVAIGSGAAGSNPYLTSLSIPASVVQIGGSAFSGCTGLKIVSFAYGTTVNASAFPASAVEIIYTGADNLSAQLSGSTVSMDIEEAAGKVIRRVSVGTSYGGFEIPSAGSGTNWSFAMGSGNVYYVKAYQVAGVLVGDVNSDGRVDAGDVLMLRMYLADMSVDIDLDMADVNGDHKVDAGDVLVLRMYLADMDVSGIMRTL